MGRRRLSRFIATGLAVCAVMAMIPNVAWASSTGVIYSFGGDEDGEYPSTEPRCKEAISAAGQSSS